jgi:crossover junction endodeoxyribonuclease RuvC
LGIDPGSITTGWALLNVSGNKVSYLDSGVLKFDQKKEFLQRTLEIKVKTRELIQTLNPDEISLESLIFVKSPTALIKLSQTRGIIISELIEKFENKIFEYSPNLVKSSTTGHGHAEKDSVRKFLDMVLGKVDYQTHDESDAAAIAFCHAVNRGSKKLSQTKKSKSKGLAGSLAHKIG